MRWWVLLLADRRVSNVMPLDVFPFFVERHSMRWVLLFSLLLLLPLRGGGAPTGKSARAGAESELES
jgi:hypothetical protein